MQLVWVLNGQDFNFNFDQENINLFIVQLSETKTLNIERKKYIFNGLEMFIYQGQKAFYLCKINPD